MTKKEKKQKLWQMRHDAHQVHHHIADCVLDMEGPWPPKLARLVEKYRAMMREAEDFERGE